jgi:hypothetical protein
MLSLRDRCVHPQTKKPYVKMSKGGLDNSPEGLQVSESMSLGIYHQQ